MFFSTVVLNGGSTPLMHPEMQFSRIVFSTFCPRASFHTAWVIRVDFDIPPHVRLYSNLGLGAARIGRLISPRIRNDGDQRRPATKDNTSHGPPRL
jgi:hypothetical protein